MGRRIAYELLAAKAFKDGNGYLISLTNTKKLPNKKVKLSISMVKNEDW